MDQLLPILVAAATGFFFGLLLSIPAGPVNLTIMNEAAKTGFKRAALISLGATVMEAIYCFIAFTGFASFLREPYINTGMHVFTFVFLLYLGVKFLTAKSVEVRVPLRATASRIGERVEQRLHPHSAFMIGLVRVMANLGVLVVWIILASRLIDRGWVRPDWPGKMACVAGSAAGIGFFYICLSFGASRGHGRLSEKTLLRMERYSGFALLGLALIYGGQIILEIIRHSHRG
jgi:threonine/homoserine/homoserine lactone efflux protein